MFTLPRDFKKLTAMAILSFLAIMPSSIRSAEKSQIQPAAAEVNVNSALSHPLLIADKQQNIYIKVGLTAVERKTAADLNRPPVNVSIVIDKSGSMSGEKIAKARQAASEAVRQLRSEDIVSIIVYSSSAEVLVPATKLTDKNTVLAQIEKITSNGSTALYEGVSKGAVEIRKFKSSKYINRIVLLSDGLANVGPQSPAELEALGLELGGDGISVTTLGLGNGYNEDLMSRLAMASDGNHAFIESADGLVGTFRKEFGAGMAVAARDATVTITCAPGVRPVRLLGRQGTIDGQTVTVKISQIYVGPERYALLEAEIEPGTIGKEKAIADTSATWTDIATGIKQDSRKSLNAAFTTDTEKAEKLSNKDVIAAAIRQIATENSRTVVRLQDEGKTEEAKQVIEQNIMLLGDSARNMPAPLASSLTHLKKENEKDLSNIKLGGPVKTDIMRKGIRAREVQETQQNAY